MSSWNAVEVGPGCTVLTRMRRAHARRPHPRRLPHPQTGAPHVPDGGSIIITSSVVGLMGFAGISGYIAAKRGQVGLMRTAAKELAPRRSAMAQVSRTGVRRASS